MRKFNAELFAQRLITKRGWAADMRAKKSLREAAKEIGISPATLSRLETQKSPPELNTYHACCKWMNLEMEFFFL